jgi:hypothetical protein
MVERVQHASLDCDRYIVHADLVEDGRVIRVFQSTAQISRSMKMSGQIDGARYVIERATKEIQLAREEYERKERFTYYGTIAAAQRILEREKIEPLKRMLRTRTAYDNKDTQH